MAFRTQPFFEMIQQRNLMLYSAVAAGFNTLLADVDAVWVQDPLAYLGTAQDTDVAVVVDNPRAMLAKEPSTSGRELCGGFVYFRSCAATKRLLIEVPHVRKHLAFPTILLMLRQFSRSSASLSLHLINGSVEIWGLCQSTFF
jgi:hypothetical protein